MLRGSFTIAPRVDSKTKEIVENCAYIYTNSMGSDLCPWKFQGDDELIWNNKNSYAYVQWLNYLLENIFKSRGYLLDGKVTWFRDNDQRIIKITNNVMTVWSAKIIEDVDITAKFV
jgi:hypothetical protein